jgi:hypothetical protein
MADVEFNDYRTSETQGQVPSVGVLVNWLGAVMSLALIVGVGVWSYQLMVRDVSGVPVVRAIEGPMRHSPVNPGGRQVAYQGLSVNEVAAAGASSGVTDALVLAPQPLDLTSEDLPGFSSALSTVGQGVSQQPTPLNLSSSRAFAENLVLLPTSVPGLNRSPRPRGRPMTDDPMAMAAMQAITARMSADIIAEVDPASILPGTRLVQLGVYDSAQDARAGWDAIARQFAPQLEGFARVIEAAQSGGSTFYRLRAHGFEDESAVRRFCAVLVAENNECIPVLIR